MYLFLFFICEWYDSTSQTTPDLIGSVTSKPMFAVIITKNRKCKKMNQTFYEYAQKMEYALNIKFTFIDCYERDFCQKYGVRHLPKFVLITNQIPKYWKYTSEKEAEGWNNFLRYELSPSADLSPMWSNEEIKAQLYSGAPYFHLTISNNNTDNILENYMAVSSKNRIYGTAFTYSYADIPDNRLTFYFSEFCSETMAVTKYKIDAIVLNRKFSAYHHFDMKDISDYRTDSFIIYISNEKMSEKVKVIDKILEKTGCTPKFNIGIAHLSTDKRLAFMAGNINIKTPTILGFNSERNCGFYYTWNESEPNISQSAINKFDGKETCTSINDSKEEFQIASSGNFLTILIMMIILCAAFFVCCSELFTTSF